MEKELAIKAKTLIDCIEECDEFMDVLDNLNRQQYKFCGHVFSGIILKSIQEAYNYKEILEKELAEL